MIETVNQIQDNFIYKQPTNQTYQYKIFINNCNSYIGSQLVETFRNDNIIQVNPNIIYGTNDSIKADIDGVDHIIDINDQTRYNLTIYQSDIIIYTLGDSLEDHRKFQYIVKLLREMKLDKKKLVICISSMINWSAAKNNRSSQINLNKFTTRGMNSYNHYTLLLQNMCLNLQKSNPLIQSSIVCSGLVYGYGQDQLFRYFKRALEQQQKLKVYGVGCNYLPTIHLQDLCQIVYGIIFSKKKSQLNYYFAVDHGKITQKEIIETISKNVGNGQFQCLPIEDTFLQTNFNIMTLDLLVDNENLPMLDHWHCKQGFISGIQRIVSQFNLYRGLKPNKIIIIGPPGGGKSKIAQILSKTYGLPILQIKSLIQDIKKQQGQFAQKIRQNLQEIKIKQIEEERKIYQDAKKKKKEKEWNNLIQIKLYLDYLMIKLSKYIKEDQQNLIVLIKDIYSMHGLEHIIKLKNYLSIMEKLINQYFQIVLFQFKPHNKKLNKDLKNFLQNNQHQLIGVNSIQLEGFKIITNKMKKKQQRISQKVKLMQKILILLMKELDNSHNLLKEMDLQDLKRKYHKYINKIFNKNNNNYKNKFKIIFNNRIYKRNNNNLILKNQKKIKKKYQIKNQDLLDNIQLIMLYHKLLKDYQKYVEQIQQILYYFQLNFQKINKIIKNQNLKINDNLYLKYISILQLFYIFYLSIHFFFELFCYFLFFSYKSYLKYFAAQEPSCCKQFQWSLPNA